MSTPGLNPDPRVSGTRTSAGEIPAVAPDPAPLRFVTAASLFDGHDAAINIMRRLIQAQGAEVVRSKSVV